MPVTELPDFDTGFTKFLDEQGLDEDELGMDDFRAQLESYKEERSTQLDKMSRAAAQPETQAAPPPSEEDTQADLHALADLKEQLDNLDLRHDIAASGGNLYQRHSIEQEQLEIRKQARPIEQRLARAKIGGVYEKATTDELNAELETALDHQEELMQQTPDERRPRQNARLEREKAETEEGIALIRQELSFRNEQRAYDEILAWREGIIAERQGVLDEIREAERNRDWAQQTAQAKPQDPRVQLDVEDAQKQVTKAHERFNSAHRSVSFPQG